MVNDDDIKAVRERIEKELKRFPYMEIAELARAPRRCDPWVLLRTHYAVYWPWMVG